MKTKQIQFLLPVICIIGTWAVQAQEIEAMDSLMNLYAINHCFNGEILVEKNDKVFYNRIVGYRNNEKQELLQPNSMFNIASISKPFTAVAILQLQEKKMLNINDPVIQYLPAFPYDKICIKHLLSHTSGIDRGIVLDELDQQKELNNDSIMNLLVKYHPELLFEPGAQWEYSNLGYDVLAIIVEQVAKMKFDAYMEKYIFRPAGMSRTFIPRTANIAEWLPKKSTETDIALPHNFKNIVSCEVQNIYPDLIKSKEYYYGATNVYSTVSDLAKFNKALNGFKILSKASQELAYRPYQLNNGDFATDSLAPIPSFYGLGWEIAIDTSYGRIVWHKGRSGGTRSVFIRNIDKKQVVAVLENNDNWGTDLKAIACWRIINHQKYKNPISQSLVQKLGCEIHSKGFEEANKLFNERREKERNIYFISKNEMIDLATILSDENNLNDALSVIQLCNELRPNDWNVLLEFADLLLKNNQNDSAIVCYQKAVPLYSENIEEQLLLLGSVGQEFFEANRLNDAEIALKLNTELFPEDCNSFDNYAFILDQNNKLDLAILMEEKAVALAESHKSELLEVLQKNLEALKSRK